MMAGTETTRILLTGATGFVGGTILDTLCDAHPDFHVKALVRQEADVERLPSIYRNIEPIVGALSDGSLLISLASEVDFIIHAAGDNIDAVRAMIDGLASHTASRPPQPRLISMTGTRSLIDPSLPPNGSAMPEARPWSDVTDAEAILSLPQTRWHTASDQATVAHGIAKNVGVILVAPGQLWGQGRGHFRKEGRVAAAYYSTVTQRKSAFAVGNGSAAWSWVSIRDLGRAVIHIVEQSLMNGDNARSLVGVNENGYYFVRAGEVSMSERAEAINQRLDLGEVESISTEEAAEMHPLGPLMWGSGAVFKADKLTALGWKPKDLEWKTLMEEEGGSRA